MSNMEMVKIKFKIDCLIDFINNDIEHEKYRINIRKENEKKDDPISREIAPWYELLVEEGEEKIHQLESYKKELKKIKEVFEQDDELGDIEEGDSCE